jgi:toxin ParE1/3/4
MMAIVRHPAALQDLEDQAAYLGRRSPSAAPRFMDAARGAFDHLARMPGMGAAWETTRPDLAGLRLWPIRGFEKHVIVYRPLDDGVEVVRVLHGARDLEAAFGH